MLFFFLLFQQDINSTPFLPDTTVRYYPCPGEQYQGVIGWDGVNFLFVWEDRRNGECDIYGARMDNSGNILDKGGGIPVCTASGDQKNPAVAFDGTNYLVVWEDWRNDTADIYGARITVEGTVLDSTGFPISTASGNQLNPTIAFDGTNYLVVWEDWRNDTSDIYGARVTPGGEVLDLSGIPVSPAQGEQNAPVMAFDGTSYMVVWEDGRNGNTDIYGARVTPAGEVIDTSGVPVYTAPGFQENLSLTFDGTNYMVVWEDWDSFTLEGLRFTPSLEVLDTPSISITNSIAFSPSICSDSNCFFVVFRESLDIFGRRLNPDGEIIDTHYIPISRSPDIEFTPCVLFNGEKFIVAWDNYSDIYSTFISPQGEVSETARVIPLISFSQSSPSISFNGTNYMVVWEDNRDSLLFHHIYASRFSSGGILLDSQPVLVSSADAEQCHPSVGSDGADYLIVWEDWRNGDADIYGARVSYDGELLDTSGIPICAVSGNQKNPAVAFDGTNYLVVWEDSRNDTSDIYGTRVSPQGEVLDSPGIPVSILSGAQINPALAFDGTNYLVVWEDWSTGYGDVYGARVTPGGELIDTVRIAITYPMLPLFEYDPSVAFDGTNYLVVWEEETDGEIDIAGARVTPDGEVLDILPIPIIEEPGPQRDPWIIFNGTEYFLVWRDSVIDTCDIRGATVSSDGSLLQMFTIAVDTGTQISPVCASGSGGEMVVVYAGWTESINSNPVNSMRIRGIISPFAGMERKESPLTLRAFPSIFTDYLFIRYSSGNVREVKICIYDICGRRVKTFSGNPEGEIIWKGEDEKGRELPSGIYFIYLETENMKKCIKVCRLR